MRSGAMLRGGDTSALPPTGINLDLQGRVELYESWRSGFAEPLCVPAFVVRLLQNLTHVHLGEFSLSNFLNGRHKK